VELSISKPTAIAKNEGVEQIEAHMLNLPQIDCPVAHHFGPGIYVREVTLPQGALAVGHAQRFEHLNVMLTGKVAIIDDGKVKVLQAPMIFVGKPGRKVGYVIETCVWQNIYATEETDIDKLEEMFLDKSETWCEFNEQVEELNCALRQEDRDDYLSAIAQYGFDEDTVRAQSQNEFDQIEMPSPWNAATSVRDSEIEGKGLFLSWPVEAGSVIAPARINGKRTPAGRFTNHSKNPNCVFVKTENEDIYLVANRDIQGCVGGSKGEELTVDYRQALELSGIQGVEQCQE
jgi:hypothetical protein